MIWYNIYIKVIDFLLTSSELVTSLLLFLPHNNNYLKKKKNTLLLKHKTLELFPTQVIFVFPFPIRGLTYTSHLCFPIWLWRPLLYFPIWLCKSLLYSSELRMRSKRRRLMPKHNTVLKIVFYNHWSLYVPFLFF